MTIEDPRASLREAARALRTFPTQPMLETRAQLLARICFASTTALGLLALMGWLCGVPELREVFIPLPPMRANAALTLLLTSLAFMLRLEARGPLPGRLARAAGVVAALIAGVTLSESIFSWDARIDQLLAHDASGIAEHPGRMSASTAACYLLLALASLSGTRGGEPSRLGRVVPLLVMLIASTAIIGYLYGVRPFYAFGLFTPLAVVTAIGLLVLSLGVVLTQPATEILHALIGDGPETTPTRRLLLGLVVIPVLLGWFAMRGHREGMFAHELGVAILATTTVFTLVLLASFTVRSLVRARRAREQLERDLTRFEAQLQAGTRMRALAAALEAPIVIAQPTGTIVQLNQAAERLFGFVEDEVAGESVGLLVQGGTSALDGVLAQVLAPDELPTQRRSTELLAKRRDGSTVPCELEATTLRTDEGAFCVLVFRDITERYRAQQALAQSEEKYRTVAVHAPVGIFEADGNGDATFVNRRWMEIAGLSFEESLGKGWMRVLHPDDADRVASAWYQAATTGLPVKLDYRYVSAKNGEVAWVEGSSVMLKDHTGKTTAYMGTLVDVTERKRALDALAKSESNFRSLVENAPFGVLVYREDTIVYANPRYVQMFGYDSVGELMGRPMLETLVHPSDRDWSAARGRSLPQPSDRGHVTVRCVRKDGEELFIEGASTPLVFDGEPASVAVAMDVTERIRIEQARLLAEQAIRESLREKEVLLKEVHHRVKNNLQVIVSLINLQAAKIENAPMRAVFDETRGRVHAIALLHERLYRSKNLGRIEMRDYLAGLVSDLASTNLDNRPIELRVESDDLYLELDEAVPIGLIVNELVTNAYKHAFPQGERERGRIEASLVRDGSDLLIIVGDDGVGMPATFEVERSDTLGILLISSLSGQLGGEARFEQGTPGTRCVVRFPDPSGLRAELPLPKVG